VYELLIVAAADVTLPTEAPYCSKSITAIASPLDSARETIESN